VRERLAELAMEAASFEVALEPRESRGRRAPTPRVPDRAQPGVPAGAAARDRLGRRAVARDARAARRRERGGGATLVFDEVDAGIGGHTARAVGEQLRALAAGRQVLCITHLPQIASLADAPLLDRQGHPTPTRRGRP
jgi:DNA repair protein RecN (Recombination protein N)